MSTLAEMIAQAALTAAAPTIAAQATVDAIAVGAIATAAESAFQDQVVKAVAGATVAAIDTAAGPDVPIPAAPQPPVSFWQKYGFLGGSAVVALGLAAAPAVYIALKGQISPKKRRTAPEDDYTLLALEGASNRAVSLLAAVAPAFAFPIAYVGIEELEQKGAISGPLGDTVQSLMATGIIVPAIGSILGSVLGGVGKVASGFKK